MNLKILTQAGLEPTISCSVGRRLIHWATEPSISAWKAKSTYSHQDHYRLFASETIKMNVEEEIAKPKQKLSFSDLFFIEFIENNLWISCYLNPGFSYFTRTGIKNLESRSFLVNISTVEFTSHTNDIESWRLSLHNACRVTRSRRTVIRVTLLMLTFAVPSLSLLS